MIGRNKIVLNQATIEAIVTDKIGGKLSEYGQPGQLLTFHKVSDEGPTLDFEFWVDEKIVSP